MWKRTDRDNTNNVQEMSEVLVRNAAANFFVNPDKMMKKGNFKTPHGSYERIENPCMWCGSTMGTDEGVDDELWIQGDWPRCLNCHGC